MTGKNVEKGDEGKQKSRRADCFAIARNVGRTKKIPQGEGLAGREEVVGVVLFFCKF